MTRIVSNGGGGAGAEGDARTRQGQGLTDANDALVELATTNKAQGVLGALPVVELDEAEAARRLLIPVEPHDHPLHLAAP